MSSAVQKNPSSLSQSLEPTIQRLKLQQREQTDEILSQVLKSRDCLLSYKEGEPLPFRAAQAGWIGQGDTIFESMAQLANKLSLAGSSK